MKNVLLICLLLPLAAIGQQEKLNQSERTKAARILTLFKDPDLNNPVLRPCQPLKGTRVEVLQRKADAAIPNFWSQVRVLEGECAGDVGWTGTVQLETPSS